MRFDVLYFVLLILKIWNWKWKIFTKISKILHSELMQHELILTGIWSIL